jgi:hypothetical protein
MEAPPIQTLPEILVAAAAVRVHLDHRDLHLILGVMVELAYNGAMAIIMQVGVEVALAREVRVQVG